MTKSTPTIATPQPEGPRATATTQTDIARLAGVSQKTVHLALHDRPGVNPATADRIRKIAAEHGYRLNAAASAMRSQSTRYIGLIVRPALQGPLTHFTAYETMLGADAALADAGYLTCLVRLTDILPDARSRVFNEVLLDGVIVIDQLPESFQEPVRNIANHCVWTESDIWEETHCIRRDEHWAGEFVVKHLARRGFCRILWIGWIPATDLGDVQEHYSYQLRLQGVRETAKHHGMEVIEPSAREMRRKNMLDRFRQHLTTPDLVVITYNSPTATALMHQLARMGLVAGQNYSLVSCDDSRRDDVYVPELTRASFNRHALGMAAGRMMLASLKDELEDCRSLLVRGSWIEGKTLVKL